jgi:oligopeptidase B
MWSPVDCEHDNCGHSDRRRPASNHIQLSTMRAVQSGSGGGGLPKLPIAVGVGLAAVGVGIVRHLIRGPTRSTPPVPAKRPHKVIFGKSDCAVVGDPEKAMVSPVAIEDDYFWMRDDSRTSKDVLDHLRQENAFTNFKTLRLRRRSRAIYQELLSHTQETDIGVPARHGPFVYYSRTLQGSSYIYHCRKAILDNGEFGEEQLLLDENEIARGKTHCDVADIAISPDHTILAYSVDFTGNEKYDILFLDIASGTIMSENTVTETNGYIEWGKDKSTVYYGSMDAAHRSNKVWYHEMVIPGSPPKGDICLYTEADEMYSVYFSKSLSGRFIFINSASSLTSESRYVDLDASRIEIHLVAERVHNVLYSVHHKGNDQFLITTNADGATNSKVMETKIDASRSSWNDFMPYKPERTILGLVAFKTFTVIQGRQDGFSSIWIVPGHDPSLMYELELGQRASVVNLGDNFEFASDTVRIVYSSMITPPQTWDYNVKTKERHLLKESPIPNYDRTVYQTERLEALSTDGTKIPISLVWNGKAVRTDGEPNFVHLYGYGSYQMSIDPGFNSNILPLLDRGVVFAIAHVRGGGEGGRIWYEAARFETKPKTFDDFVACAEFLVSSGRATANMLSMEGRSAGGLLMGAVMNKRPELFRAVIAGVPFVDVLNTMSDANIPLTTGEWLEWGNPHQQKYFDAIRSYCPYQNVGEKSYPAVLAVAGLHDPRVMYSEPCKWVAKLREHSTSGRDILLKIDLESGHFSASDRYHYKRERAFELAWLLDQLGAPVAKVAG